MSKCILLLTVTLLLVIKINALTYENTIEKRSVNNTFNNNQTKASNEHFEELKRDAEKFKAECKTGSSGEEKSETKYGILNESSSNQEKWHNNDYNGNQNNNASSRTNWNSDGNSQNKYWDTSEGRSGDLHNNGDNHNPSYGYDSHKTNANDDYNDYSRTNTHNSQADYSRSPYNYGYNTDGYTRAKRSEDIECISQCVFGYLEVLDDNRSLSEYALIKWLQDHIPSDTKRIKAIRETRKCFARYAASDNEDGCSFSKSLSNCLDLDLEN